MDLEFAKDLDIALSLISNGDRSFTVLDGEHKEAKCILRQDIHACLITRVSEGNRDKEYIDYLLHFLYRHKYIYRSVHDDHIQPYAPGRLFLRRGGYVGRLKALEEETTRREEERAAQHQANVTAVESADRADKRAHSANTWAKVSAICAVLAFLPTAVPPVYRVARAYLVEHYGKDSPTPQVKPLPEQGQR